MTHKGKECDLFHEPLASKKEAFNKLTDECGQAMDGGWQPSEDALVQESAHVARKAKKKVAIEKQGGEDK